MNAEEYNQEEAYWAETSQTIISAFAQMAKARKIADQFGLSGMEWKAVNHLANEAGCSVESYLSVIATGVVPWEDFGS